jgi:uncharacterized protein (DUF1684 family)
MPLFAVVSLVLAFSPMVDESYLKEVEAWRAQREAKLRADDGWLTVVDLAWLKPGETRMGADPTNDVVLPSGAPSFVGTIRLERETAEFHADPSAQVTRDGKSFEHGTLRSDAGGKADVLVVGGVRIILLKRGARYALRIKDNNSQQRTQFAGCRWYPAREDWRITAKFIAEPSTSKITMDTIIGEPITLECPGYVVFERGGKEYRLQAAVEGDKLWFVFRDATSGKTTHPGARQLLADMPKNGVVTLDFNKAINLPCSFTPHATCPLAPPANRLKLAVEAGEMKYEPKPGSSSTTPGSP